MGAALALLATLLGDACVPLLGSRECNPGTQKHCGEVPGTIVDCSGGEGYYYWHTASCGGIDAVCVPDSVEGAVCTSGSTPSECTTGVLSLAGAVPIDWSPQFAADVDGDGLRDILFVARDHVLHLARGAQGATFSQPDRIFVSDQGPLTSAQAADVDGDENLDLVVSSTSPDELSVLIGNGAGTFTPGRRYLVDTALSLDAAAEMDGDVRDEILAKTDSTVGIGTGSSATTIHVLSQLTEASSTDVKVEAGLPNAPRAIDGRTTAARFKNSGGLGFAGLAQGIALMFVPNGSGGFTRLPEIPLALAFADFDGDGLTDVLTTPDNGETLQTLLSVGDGTFRQGPRRTIPSGFVVLSVGDVDGDKKPDLVNRFGADSVAVFKGNGDGTFAAGDSFTADAEWSLWTLSADFDDDGREDIAVPTTSGGILVLRGACTSP